jgi:hypothetical protein
MRMGGILTSGAGTKMGFSNDRHPERSEDLLMPFWP